MCQEWFLQISTSEPQKGAISQPDRFANTYSNMCMYVCMYFQLKFRYFAIAVSKIVRSLSIKSKVYSVSSKSAFYSSACLFYC